MFKKTDPNPQLDLFKSPAIHLVAGLQRSIPTRTHGTINSIAP
jgi:hypothetical protein